VALSVQQELETRTQEVDRLRRQQVERARYEAELAQRRYLRVDPDNRLVASSLEADWNQKLRTLAEAQDEYERQCQAGRKLDQEQRARVRALADDFPRLWRDPNTPDRERKRIVRLILDDVTLLRREHIVAHVRFRGGAARTLELPLPLPAPQARKTAPLVIREIDRLLDGHTDREIADILNERGLRSGEGRPFHRLRVHSLREGYGLTDRFTRLRSRGMLTLLEMAARLDVCTRTVKRWRQGGLLRAHRYDDKGGCLYEPPADAPTKWKHKLPRRTSAESRRRGAV
jgi:hypothetical protein